MLVSNTFERLVSAFCRLPGIGKKSAQRFAWHIINGSADYAAELADVIKHSAEVFSPCQKCNMISESNPCSICSSSDRNVLQLCIVESSADVLILENLNEYRGMYFVLGHLLSPLDGYGPEQIKSSELQARVCSLSPKEVILALKPTPEGEATIHYLTELLERDGLNITRLSTGIPFGGDLEYLSSMTLYNAWKRRFPV